MGFNIDAHQHLYESPPVQVVFCMYEHVIKKYFKPMIIYFRSATCFRNAKMFRSAFCLNEFPMVVEANDKADVLNVFKFCHQTNKL